MIKNIIFDFGGVLIDWNPRHLYQNIFLNDLEMEYFLTEICSPEWNHKQDAGRSFKEATKELVNIFPEYKQEINKFDSDWIKMINGEIEENVALIKTLKNKYRLFGLTNWSAEKFSFIYNQYKFFNDFEDIIVSGEEKIAKPDIRIFDLLLNRFEITAVESLFIDDSLENIITANMIGLQTIHLEKDVNLESELLKLDLI